MKTRVALVFSDAHFPYIDRRAYDLMIKVALDLHPDIILSLGDLADFYNINAHGKNLDVEETFSEEIDIVISELALLHKEFKTSEKIFIEGNHENRLQRFITNNCAELTHVLELEKLLCLKTFNFKFIPYGPAQAYKINTLTFRHEPIGGGENFASSSLKRSGCSLMFGHQHKIQEAQSVTLDGSYQRAISIGCLCDKNHPVMQYVKYHHQWQLGFAIVTFLDDGKKWFAQNIHILPGKKYYCQVNGKIYIN